ncbi:MAG: hypothetical protein IKT40_08795 [Bacilli bacterium]|nr:hypothetical protein [Bacilli bacterium]
MKILDNDFRKNLYKSLMDAGYDKAEAQNIVGVKYINALKEKVSNTMLELNNRLQAEDYDFSLDETWLASFNSDLAELKKMKEIVQS